MIIEDLVRSDRIRKINNISIKTMENQLGFQHIVEIQICVLHIKPIL